MYTISPGASTDAVAPCSDYLLRVIDSDNHSLALYAREIIIEDETRGRTEALRAKEKLEQNITKYQQEIRDLKQVN